MIESYLLLFCLIFFINVIPAFMPPTWIILAFIVFHYNLEFFPTLILAVIAATLGRVALAILSRHLFIHIFSKKTISNYKHLGFYLEKNQKLTIPIVLGYAFTPISSNTLFIVAGLSHMKLGLISFSFMLGRLASYSFWITTSHQIAYQLEDIFEGSVTSSQALIGALLSVVLVIIIGYIPWPKVLKIKKKW